MFSEQESINDLEEKISTEAEVSSVEDRIADLCLLITHFLNVDLKKAKKYINEANSLATQYQYNEGIGLSLQHLGVYNYQLNDFDAALENYLKADVYLSKNKNWNIRIKPKTNIAMLYVRTQQYEDALKIYHQIESEVKDIPTNIVHAQLFINIDAAYTYLKQSETAVQYALKALAIAEDLESAYGQAISTSNLGFNYIELKQFEKGFEYLQRSIALCDVHHFGSLQMSNFMKLTNYYLLTSQYKEALAYADKTLELSHQYNCKEHEAETYKYLTDVYENMGDYKSALEAAKKHHQLREEITNTEKAKARNALQLKYEADKKEADINALKLLQSETELTALKSQMNPHFIFNALNSIQELYTVGDKKTANEQMGNFAQLTRKILDVSSKQNIELSEEIEIITKYLELESMRFENNFTYQIHIAEEIDEDYTTLPPMLIQPYIENAIKHGLMHVKGNKILKINFKSDKELQVLKCIIDDNGIGRKAAAAINKKRPFYHQSFATSATEKRLQLLNQNKTNVIAVVFEDKEDETGNSLGTKVTLRIPLN